MTTTTFRVQITRVAHQIGIARQTPIGHVRYSRDFDSLSAAAREADAWSATGEFAHYAPSNFRAVVQQVEWRDMLVTPEGGTATVLAAQ